LYALQFRAASWRDAKKEIATGMRISLDFSKVQNTWNYHLTGHKSVTKL